MIRENGGGMAYTWSAAESTWEQIGEVVAPPGSLGMQVNSPPSLVNSPPSYVNPPPPS